MKIVVIGGTGLIGRQVVAMLKAQGVEAIAASPANGVDAATGTGLSEVLQGAQAVVDVSNTRSFEPTEVLAFFEGSTRNLLAAEQRAGVEHHVLLSILGAAAIPGNPYYRAKVAQEALVAAGPVPYTIVQAAQFFEFVPALVEAGSQQGSVRATPSFIQPIASREVAETLARVASAAASNDVIELAGPQLFRIHELVAMSLAAAKDPREVIEDPATMYFGAAIPQRAFVPRTSARLGTQRYAEYLLARAR